MTILDFLQWFVFFLGATCVVMACRFIIFFAKSKERIAISLKRMLFEQVITSFSTLLFSFGSLYYSITGHAPHNWNNFSPVTASLIRIVMFGAMLHSTWHLANSIKDILNRDDNN